MEKKLKPYTPPQITRVVMRREQALLSQCSLTASSSAGVDLMVCDIAGCAKSAGTGTPYDNISDFNPS